MNYRMNCTNGSEATTNVDMTGMAMIAADDSKRYIQLKLRACLVFSF